MDGKTPHSARRGKDAAYHHGDLRQALLNAASELLATEGLEAVGIREIARRAGVSHAAPYRHYPNRDALLADLAAAGFERLGRRFAQLPDADAADRRLVDMARGYVRFARDEPQAWRLMFGDAIDKTAYPALLQVSRDVFEGLRRTVLALGVAAPAITETTAAWAMAHGIAQLVLDHRLDAHLDVTIDPDELVREAAVIFLAGLRRTRENP
ncbi:TetR/AcrR family transcriptional regulator [Dokdonella sp.]|uniref:TetR/AcrR family transcriptional regulator n=1 Tax=Dokdonella sp. TaxID=2291710 RepID=UPI002603BB9B|nr:TetR/AcrR family transcriptional regulator [Dokdonella sp.]